MAEEIWRVVDENPDYMISNKNGWYNTKTKGKQPFGSFERGYRCVSMGRGHRKPYHVLVAKAFPEICGEWFEGAHVHHKDFDKLNNVPENLIVITSIEHAKLHYQETSPDSFKKTSEKRAKAISRAKKGKSVSRHVIESMRNANLGRRKPAQQKPIIQLTLDGRFVKRWDCAYDIKKENGWSEWQIVGCCKHKPHFKTAHGYVWKYEKEEDN